MKAAVVANAASLLLAGIVFAAISDRQAARAGPSGVERLSDEVYVVRDDDGNWGGGTMGITHQRNPGYRAKKILDLSNVPDDFWKAATTVRLSAFFCVRDYSWHDGPKPNGLDGTLEIVINGKVHRVANNAGLPVYVETKPTGGCIAWHDFALPKEMFVRGPNEIIFSMTPPEGRQSDDYLYLGIDNTAPGGKSYVQFSRTEKWRQDKLTVPGGKGEYMVRLYLLRGPRHFEADWHATEGRMQDPAKILQYAGSHGPATRVEWNPLEIDRLSPVQVVVETADQRGFAFHWLDDQGQPIAPALKASGPRFEATLKVPLPFRPRGVELDKRVPVKAVTLKASKDYHPMPARVDMAPLMEKPKGACVDRKPSCTIEADKVVLANANLRCTFRTAGGRLHLASLYNEPARAEMVRRPEDSALLVIEVGGKRLAGSRDFVLRSVEPVPERQGFKAVLFCEPLGLEAVLSVWIDAELHMGLELTNRAAGPVDFKVAFPHLAGLAISDRPVDDYYFFPWGGGIISDAPALIRRGYGDHEALYQLIDLFSPERGGGLAVRSTDADGRHKVLALRKHIPGRQELNGDVTHTPTSEDYKWTNCLDQVPGIGLTFEYLRRTRKPGEAFAPKEVALRAHSGDWHVAMQAYADWCHRVWKFRPYPSRLGPVVNMLAAGWGQSPLFRDGKYRTDFIKPRCDCIELMSWWEWSPLGPWSTPWDKLEAKIGKAACERWKNYFVKDPVTGRTMFNNNPADYDGYNQRFGGLPALRNAIKKYREMGAIVTLYTDPLRADDNSKFGRKWGKQWCVVQPDGTDRTNYDAWNPCLDVAEYRRWVAQTMRRVMRETGADGIRLDEYGHRGAACFSKLHKHTFAEWGCTEWQRCIAESCKLVRQAMDEVKPGSVLTTEHPGYDYLMQFLEGCITYDLTVMATPLRPMECNTQRFYFPECKAYELDHRGADRKHRKRFWNAVASFGSYYPVDMDNILRENDDAFAGRDCRPLVPTLAKYVYANRFRAGKKTIYTLYNATGHTFAGSALRLDLRPDEHLFDLLRCKDADTRAEQDGTVVEVFLARDDVACLARLPAVLAVKRVATNVIEAGVAGPGKAWRVALCAADGESLLGSPVTEGTVRLNIEKLPKDAGVPVCVKLLDGRRLVDVVALPPTAP